MNILVFSDTHGACNLMYDIVSKNKLTTDLVIHLGDNLKDAQDVMREFPTIAFLGVLGNCDYAAMHPGFRYDGAFTAEKRRLFYTHGHKYNVEYGLEYIVSNAKINNANVVLYGHTHVATFEKVNLNGVDVINPGSLSKPRDGSNGTYAHIVITNEKLNYEIIEVEK